MPKIANYPKYLTSIYGDNVKVKNVIGCLKNLKENEKVRFVSKPHWFAPAENAYWREFLCGGLKYCSSVFSQELIWFDAFLWSKLNYGSADYVMNGLFQVAKGIDLNFYNYSYLTSEHPNYNVYKIDIFTNANFCPALVYKQNSLLK